MRFLTILTTRLDCVTRVMARIAFWMSAAILLAIVGVITAEVFCRTFLGTSLFVVEELVGYLLAAFTMFGLVHILQTRTILRVEVVYRRLSMRSRTIADLALGLFGMVYLVIVEYQIVRLVSASYRRGAVSVTLLSFPLWIPQSLIAVAGFFLCITLAQAIVQNICVIGGGTVPDPVSRSGD